jgi:hypothetical protein
VLEDWEEFELPEEIAEEPRHRAPEIGMDLPWLSNYNRFSAASRTEVAGMHPELNGC